MNYVLHENLFDDHKSVEPRNYNNKNSIDAWSITGDPPPSYFRTLSNIMHDKNYKSVHQGTIVKIV